MSTSFGTFGATFGQLGAGGGVLLPASPSDIIQWLKGGTTDGLTLLDKKDTVDAPELRDVGCLTLTDTDTQFIEMGTIDVSTWTELHLKGWFKTDTDGDHIFSMRHTGGDDFRLFIGAGGNIRLRIDDGTVHELVAFAADYSDDAWHYFEAGFAGTTSYLKIEAEDKTLGGVSFDFSTADGETVWGAFASGTINNWNGELSMLELHNQDGLYSKLPLQEGAGSVAYDTSGNAINGEIKNGTGVLADMHVVTDGIPSRNHEIGFSYFSDEVSIPLYYNDAKMSSIITMDDMYLNASKPERWDNFVNMAAWLSAANVVPSSGIIISSNTDAGWGAQATADMISDPLHFITHHSYNHPLLWPDTTAQYTQEYVTSKEEILSSVTYPDLWRYNGSNYLTTMWQWGGWGTATPPEFPLDDPDDPAWAEVWSILADANYLALRNPVGKRGVSFGYPLAWNNTLGIFDNLNTTSSQGFIIDGSGFDQTDWDHAYNNNGYYYLYIHPYLDAGYYNGSNSADWTAWLNYIKDKPDVWYTDTDSFINYKYMREVARPETTWTESGADVIVNVRGNSAQRDKYGLSTPMTYKIKKPSAWGTDDALVYHRLIGGEWSLMTEKTALDVFTAINCFRNSGSDVYVSQAFGQATSEFELKLERVV